MSRKCLSLLIFAVVGTLSGCTMCDDSYDYCGPVVGSASFPPVGGYGAGYQHEGEMIVEEGAVIDSAVQPMPEQMPAPQSSRPIRRK